MRGTVKKWNGSPYGRSPTLANKLAKLEREVKRSKPELQHFIKSGFITWSSAGVLSTQLAATRELINDASFRDQVTGDKWVNANLMVKLAATSASVQRLRVVVYCHKRAGTTTYGFTNTTSNFRDILDPTAIDVIGDYMVENQSSNSPILRSFRLPLRMRQTQYNSGADTIDRNAVQIAIIGESTATGIQLYYAYKLSFYNK